MSTSRLRICGFILTVVTTAVVLVVTLRPGSSPVEAAGQPKAAGQPTPLPPEIKAAEEAIRSCTKDYLMAMSKGDLDGVMTCWADDADYIDESGTMTRGKEQIAAKFKPALTQIKGHEITGRVHSRKFLRPEICLEDGTLEFKSHDGTKASSRYAVVWTRAGDRWLISSVRDLPSEVTDLPSLASAQLKQLEWLVGEWTDDGGKGEQTAKIYWGPNKAFLLMDYKVKQGDLEPLDVVVRVGWDGLNGAIRSWIFDSQGGFAEGLWEKNGKKWLIGHSGVLPDGGTGESTNHYEFIDENTFVWRATEREVDGQPLADAEIKFVRKNAK